MKHQKKRSLIILIGVLAVLLLALPHGWNRVASNRDRVILIVTKHQADTRSLNPTRLEVATALALEDTRNEYGEELPIRHHIIRYTGDESEGYRLADAFLSRNRNVAALVGDFNSPGTGYVAKLAERHRLPHLSFLATDETLFEEHSMSLSYRAPVSQETVVLTQLVQDVLQSRRVVSVYSELGNLSQRWDMMKDPLERAHIGVFRQEEISRETNDFRLLIRELNREKDAFDTVLLFLSAVQTDHFLQQAQLAGMKRAVVISPVSLAPDTLGELPEVSFPVYSAMQRFFLCLHHDKDPALVEFAQVYRSLIGYHQVDGLGPWIYDGTRLLHQQMREEADPEKLYQKLLGHDEDRMVGRVWFDVNGLLQGDLYAKVRIDGPGLEVIP